MFKDNQCVYYMAKMSTTKLSPWPPWPCPLLIWTYFLSCGDSYYRTVNNTNPTPIGLETIGWTDGPTDFLLWSIFLLPIVYYLLVIFLLPPYDDRTMKLIMLRVRVFSYLNFRDDNLVIYFRQLLFSPYSPSLED